MVYTLIKEIKTDLLNNKQYFIIHFEYMNKERFTYVSPETLTYWRKRLKDSSFNFTRGLMINVFKVPYSQNYKIIGVK